MFDKVIIVDESQTMPQQALLSPDRPRAFIPIFSTKGYGKDTDVKLFQANSQEQLVRLYGQPHPNRTLTPLYYAYRFLAGGGDVYVSRIVSKTSTFANAVILAKGREGADMTNYEVIFEIQAIENATNLQDLIDNAESLLNNVPDENGYRVYPIAVVGMNWTGLEGNKYTFRLLPNKSLEKVIDARAYQLETRSSATSAPVNVGFSTDEDAMVDGEPIYANDIFESQSPDIFFHVLSTYNTFLSEVSAYVEGEEYIDIFFGAGKDGTKYPNYVIQEESVDFTSAGGIQLSGGSDGDFDISVPNRVDNMMTRLVEAFQEDQIKILENEYKYHIDFVFDFGASQEVKDAIVAFANRRKSTSPVIDTGMAKSKTAILNMRKSGNLNYNDNKVILVSGVAGTRDPFTNKKIEMPMSYFEAFAIPNHITTYEGGARPFAGANYSYPDMLPGTYQPYFYSEEEDMVEEFVDNRINFAFEEENGYTAFHQSTCSKMDSALAERNNVYLMHKIIRTGLLAAKEERWNFLEDSDIERYQEYLIRRVGIEVEGQLGEFDLTAQREGTIGPERNRVLVTATVRFKYINKGTTFKFTVI